jgi:predicted negative regulator of RcsB-dependent stress response
VLTANGDHQAALKELDDKDPGTFAAAFDELRGDIQLTLGDLNAARTFYQQALESARAEQGDTVVLEMKLESIGSAGQE